MAYIKKIITQDEELIGIARLHWIYALRGILWFAIFAGAGWLFDFAITKAMMSLGSATDNYVVPAVLTTISSGVLLFMLAGGAMIFFLFVLKILVTEVALTTRRIIHKEGLLFVKVKHIDHEEIRGENMDMGYFGRILGYGYLMLDCRFIGDVRLPAIENPERFLRALHKARAETQDALSVMVGKTGAGIPINVMPPTDQQQPEVPQPSPPQPTPEIQPGQPGTEPEVSPPQTPTPEMPPIPVPHNPPPPPQAPPQPESPPAQPTQPIPAPPPTQPPLQPPSEALATQQQVSLDPKVVAQVVQQVMPQMAEQVVKQMAQQGLLHQEQPEAEKDIDTDLMTSFDVARLDKNGKPDGLHDKMEHALH